MPPGAATLIRARPSVSVVVPTHERRSLLPTMLARVLAEPAATEVIVVVDGCNDGSIEFLHELARGEPRLRPCWIENQGENAARQHGVGLATGDVVLLLDDDLLALPGLVEGHARHHADRAGLVVMGYTPPQLPARRRGGHAPLYLFNCAYENACRRLENDPRKILLELWGGHVSLRREDCDRVGLWDPGRMLGYHTDREFGLRCLDAGLHGVFDRSLRAEHRYVRSMEQFAQDRRQQGRNLVRLHQRYPQLLGPLPRQASRHRCAARGLHRVAEVPPLQRTARRALLRIGALAQRAGLAALELECAKVLARLELQTGMIEASTSVRPVIRATDPHA